MDRTLMAKRIVLCLTLFTFAALVVIVAKRFNARQNDSRSEREEFTAGGEDDPYAAARFRFEMIAGAKRIIDPASRLLAIQQSLLNNAPTAELRKGTTISSWTALGPGNIGGRIRSIIVKPNDGTQILVGAVAGGVWKSTNTGASWTAKMDNEAEPAIGCMVIDPANNNVVYAGTGEGWGNYDAVYGGGIYKSTDFGETWTLLSSTTGANIWNFRNILKMAFDASGNLYAVTKAFNYAGGVGSYFTNGGLYKSTDGGTSWTKISSTTFTTNYFNGCDVLPISSSVILFGVESNGATLGGIYQTTDGGASWNKISTGLPTANYGRIVFAKDPSSTSVYSVFESINYGSPDFGLAGIFHSTDNGSSWTALTRPSNLTSTGGLSYLSTQGWYDNVIAVDPSNSNTIYVAGVDMMKSTNAGSSWSQLTFWDPSFGTPVVHADHHAIAFNPTNSSIIYSGNDGGIYQSTNGGGAWTNLNNNLAITQFYGGAVYATGTNYQGGTQDNGHLKYAGSGTNWSMVFGGDGGYAAIDQSNTNVAFEEYTYLQMSKTTDNGATWNASTSGLTDAGNSTACLFIAPFSMNPDNSSVLVAGSNRIWLTTNSAGGWTQVSNVLAAGALISAVSIFNSTSPYLALAGTTNGKVFLCTSLTSASGTGNSWTDVTPAGNNGAWVRRIALDLNNKQSVYACYSGYNNDGLTPSRHIYYSSNQGTSWTDKSGNLPDVPVHTLVVDNSNSQTLYIGTETGVYQSVNGGTTWSQAASGMPTFVPVDQLVRQTGTDFLFAFTHGRSAFATNAPLPVEITSFVAALAGTGVQLKWTVATQLNNYGFDIERSPVAASPPQWGKIGFVAGSGTSFSPQDFTYGDLELSPGRYTYRLKQIDADGTFKYFGNAEIEMPSPSSFSLDQNYPNPFNPRTTIRYHLPTSEFVTVKIFDLLGREIATLVSERKDAGNYSSSWDGTTFPSGVYFYSINAGGFSATKKFVLQK